MLKKVGFGLLALALVSSAIDPFTEDFERPWNYEYKWPGNSSVVDYVNCFPFCPAWNVNVIQASVDSLATGSVEGRYLDEKTRSAHANYTETKNIAAQVNEFADYGTAAFLINAEDICGAIGVRNCSCFFSGTYLTCTNVQLDREMRYRIATRALSPAYSAAWTAVVDGALDSLAGRAGALNREMAGMEAKYGEVNYTGACAPDVSGHENCERAEDLLAGVEGGSTAAQYRNLTEIRMALDNNSMRVHDDVPMLAFGWVANALGNESGGAIGEAKATNAGLEAHYEQVKKTYEVLSKETDAEISAASATNASAAYHELWRIRAGPAFGGIAGGEATQVSALARAGSLELASSLQSRGAASFAMAYQRRGYLRDALLNMTNAKLLASQSKDALGTAVDNAELVAEAYEAKATEALGRAAGKYEGVAKPSRVEALCDAAEGEISEARREPKMGRRFEHYVSAIAYAEEAYGIEPGNEADANWSAIAACARASGLISRAGADGIDVSQETAYFSILNRSGNATVLAAGCGDIIESVTLSAQYKYSHLGAAREEAIRLLGVCGADCNDLIGLLDDGERGLVVDGSVAYPEAIGSLRALETTYSRLKTGAVQSISRQIGNYLVARKTIYVGSVSLDQPRMSRLEVWVTNTVDYAGQNVEAEVESPLEFGIDDVVEGADNLRGAAYLGGKLRLYVKNIGALASEGFVFEKNQTVLRTKSMDKEAIGYEDYSARVTERREIECTAEMPGFYAEDYWDGVSIDGVGAGIQDGYVRRPVSEGTHELEADYSVGEAYEMSVSEEESTRIGNRVYYKYQMAFEPAIDMQYLESFAALPESQYVKEPRAITISGERVDAVRASSGFVLRVHGLVKGKAAKIEVSYYVDNSSQYAEGEIAELGQRNLSDEAGGAVDEARRRLAANDTAGAIESIQRAYLIIEQEELSAEKMRAERSKYYGLVDAERARIRAAVADGYAETQFRDILLAREAYLEDVLNSLDGESLEGQVAALKAYDKGWLPDQLRLFRKNASVGINRMYSGYLGVGVENSTLAAAFSELRERYNAFEASGGLEDACKLDTAIAKTGQGMDALEAALAAERGKLLSEAQALRDEVSVLAADYAGEYAAAKGTRFEGVFKLKADDAQAGLKQADADLKKGNASTVAGAHRRLAGLKANMSETLGYLGSLAERAARQAKEASAAASGRLSEKDSKEAALLSSEMDGYLANGEFVKALKDADEIMAIAEGAEGGGRYETVLWLSAIFVGAVVVVYFFRGRKGGKPEKIMRKLEKAV